MGVDPKTGYGQINIVYHVTEGNPYRVGNIRLTGNNRTKDYVIRQELPLQSNDPMNAVDLDTAQKRLQNLNYFDMVDVAQVGSTRPGYRDINIEVAEKRTGSLNIGVAFSSIESVYLFAGITQSNFDMYDWSSFVGGGQRFAINARVGLKRRMPVFPGWIRGSCTASWPSGRKSSTAIPHIFRLLRPAELWLCHFSPQADRGTGLRETGIPPGTVPY